LNGSARQTVCELKLEIVELQKQPKLVGIEDMVGLGVLAKPYMSSKKTEIVELQKTTQVGGGYGLNGSARQTVCELNPKSGELRATQVGYGLQGSAMQTVCQVKPKKW